MIYFQGKNESLVNQKSQGISISKMVCGKQNITFLPTWMKLKIQII